MALLIKYQLNAGARASKQKAAAKPNQELMYKIYTGKPDIVSNCVYKIWLIMRLTTVILITFLMQVSAAGLAQKISLSKSDAPLRSILKDIRKQSGFNFVYTDDLLKLSKPVTINVKGQELQEVLQKIFDEQPLTYTINKNTITIKEKDRSMMTKIIDYFSAIDVRGKVVDEVGEPLQGATVKVKGSVLGTMTDKDGEFFLKGVPEDAVIVIAYLGYKPLELKVSASMGVIKLQLATSELEEVTVSTGYWTTTKALSTGNISKVTAKEIGNQPVTSPLMALQGLVPGLEITPASGAPAGAPKIRIRGTNSLRQQGVTPGDGEGNYPLYVIDGVPVNSAPLNSLAGVLTSQGFDPLSTINPSNIESIEVLKDGDATAVYGSRGANGVILITTKRSSRQTDKIDIDATIYSGIGKLAKYQEVLNRRQYLSMRMEALAYAEETPEQALAVDLFLWDTTRNTNWQKVLLGGSAKITDIQTGISSAAKNTSFRFNSGYHKETLIAPGDFGYSQYTGQFSINHLSQDQKFKFAFSTIYGVNKSEYFAGDLVQAALTLPPNAPQLYNADGSLNWELHDYNGLIGKSTWSNPLSTLRNTQHASASNSISNLNISYYVSSDFNISINTGFTNVLSREMFNNPKGAYPPGTKAMGTATFFENDRMSWIIEPKVSYMKLIGEHRIDFIAGTTLQKNKNGIQNINADKYTSDAMLGSLKGAGDVRISLDDLTEYKYNSIYARFGYNWREKLILNLTGRRDGSSRFGPGKRFGNFGSIGAAWIFSEENFAKRAFSFMSFGKLRGSYGSTGSDNVGDYNYYNLYTLLDQKYGGLSGTVPFALYNPDYAWEVTNKMEAAVELSFFQNQVGLELSWYRNRSSNQLVSYPLSEVTGFPYIQANFNATVENSGLEAVFRMDFVDSKAWRWNATLNFSAPRNRLAKFDGIENSPYVTIYKVGEPLSVQWLYTWKGVNKETGTHEFVDENEDGVLNDLFDRTLHNMTGKVYNGGLNNSIQYKSLEVSFLFQFARQQSKRFPNNLPPGSISNQPIDVLNRWRKPGDVTDVQRFSLDREVNRVAVPYTRYNMVLFSNYNTTDASFIRLKTLAISYLISNQRLNKVKIKNLRVFFQAQNLLTFTRYNGLDPETGFGLPPLRLITAGLQFKF